MSILVGNPFFLDAGAGATGYQISRSLRFNSSDSSSLSLEVSGSTTTYTASMWVKRSAVGNGQYQHFFFSKGGDGCGIGFDPSDKITLYNSAHNLTDAVYRDPSAWYHILLSVNSGTAALYVNNTLVKSGITGFQWSNTATIGRYNISAAYFFNGYIADVYLIDGQALTPSSFTEVNATTGQLVPKAYTGTFGTNGFWLQFSDNSSNTPTTLGKDYSGNGINWTPNNFSVFQTTGNYAAYVYASGATYDGSATGTSYYTGAGSQFNGFDGSTSTNVGGSDVASSWVYFRPTPSLTNVSQLRVFSSAVQQIYINGSLATVSPSVPNGTAQWYTITSPPSTVTEIAVQGQTAASAAGRFAAIEVNGSILIDNKFAANNDSLVDTPTSYGTPDTGVGGEVRGNYCLGNPIHPNLDAAPVTLSNGSLNGSITSGSNWYTGQCTLAVTTGKWYFEQTIVSGYAMVGIAAVTAIFSPANDSVGSVANSVGYFSGGSKYVNGPNSSYGATYGANDVIGCAFDMGAQTVTFYKNGVSQGTISSCITSNLAYAPCFSLNGQDGAGSYLWNFGQRAFSYPAPAGYKCLVDTNLTAPTIAKPSTVMDVKLYTGTGSLNSLTGLGFSPDLVWIKNRGASAAHRLFDVIRGVGKSLRSNTTDVEVNSGTGTDTDLYSFDSAGFTVGSATAGTAGDVNTSSNSYVAWCWDAGSSTVTNTAGSITSSVRVNLSAGFSIVSYTGNLTAGATVGHGLNAVPAFFIVKNRDSVANWSIYHASLGATQRLLFTTSAATSGLWNDTAPTSTVFSLLDASGVNGSGEKLIAYCFAPVAGYSSFGRYVGNGSSDGPFVYTGFKPRVVLIKKTTGATELADWAIFDAARSGYNANNNSLYPSSSQPEDWYVLATEFDLLSNGFKPRASRYVINSSGETYIYCAFAENPFQYARAR